VDNNKKITHLSLCSGYEGIGLGLRSVLPNLREIAYVEREGFCVANLVAKMEAGKLDAAPVFTDVKTFPYGKFRGIVDILSGGFPCQPFSAAGKRQATEDPRHLFPYIADGIRECQPRIVFLENVQGILSCKTADGEPVLQYVLRELEGMGYRATAGIFSAEEVGAPHQRKRVFILGVREELGNSNSRRCSPGEQPRSGSKEIGGGNKDRQPTELRSGGIEQSPINRWPSRPGEAQQEWEEPRVVADSQSARGGRGLRKLPEEDAGIQQPKKCRQKEASEPNNASEEPKVVGNTQDKSSDVSNDNGELGQSECREPRGAAGKTINRGQAEPQLGRASNGSSSRVDRLRLLGNGVVPQTAAKAFVTLINRLT
jgi:DNA (cytosine-5)-methyltransferase 1